MAVSYVSSSSNKSTTTTVVITAPTGIENGDILVAFVSAFRATNATTGDITYPNGWALWAQQITSTRYKCAMMWKRASGESGNYTFGSASAVQMQGAIGVYRGCIATGDPRDVFSNTAYVTSNATVRAATITPNIPNGFYVYGGWYYLAGTISLGTPSGMNARQTQANTNCAIRLADLAYTTATASGNKDATAGGTCTVKHAMMVALKSVPTNYTLYAHPQVYEINTVNTGSDFTTNFGGAGQTDFVDNDSDGLADGFVSVADVTYSIVTGNGFTGNAQRATGANGGHVAIYLEQNSRNFQIKVTGKYRASSDFALWDGWYGTIHKYFPANTGTPIPFTHTFLDSADPSGWTTVFLGVPLNGNQWVELDEISVKEVFPPTVDFSITRAPTVALNSPNDGGSVSDTTPSLLFTGTDTDAGQTLEFEVHIDTADTFSSQSTPGDNYPIGGEDGGEHVSTGGWETSVGQSFTALGGKLEKAVFDVMKVLSPTGSVYCRIYETTGTPYIPTGAAIATSDAFDISTLPTGSSELREFTFSGANCIQLVKDGIYFVALEYTGGSATDYLWVGIDSTGAKSGSNGAAYTSSWAAIANGDLIFYVYELFPLIVARSATDNGFTTGHPYDSGEQVTYTVQTALDADSYYWRVRGTDSAGATGGWSEVRSFTISSAPLKLTATPQSYSLTLQSADLSVKRNYRLTATAQAYLETGVNIALTVLSANVRPTVALNSPDDLGSTADTTPDLVFTGTDLDVGETLEYQVQVDTVNTFNSQVIEAFSSIDTFAFNLNNPNPSSDWFYQGVGTGSCQAFTGKVGKITKGSWNLYKVGTPPGNVYMKLYAHSGTYGSSSLPTGSALATSEPILATSLGTTASLVEFTFSGVNQYALQASTYYCIAVEYSDADSNSSNSVVNQWNTVNLLPTNGGYRTSAGVWVVGNGCNVFSVSIDQNDAGFLDYPDEGDTHPFTNNTAVAYTVQTALENNTQYFWRVRAKNSSTGIWGAWSDIYSFTTLAVITATTQTYSLTGQDATFGVLRNYTEITAVQSFNVTGQDATFGVLRNYTEVTAVQSFSVSGVSADLKVQRNYSLSTIKQTYILTGVDAGLDEKLGFAIYATPQVYVLTGVSIGIKRDSHIGLSVQDFNVTGVEIDLKIKRNYKLTATPQSYSLTLQSADFRVKQDYKLAASIAQTFQGTGVDITLTVIHKYTLTAIGQTYFFGLSAEIGLNFGAEGQTDWVDSNADGWADYTSNGGSYTHQIASIIQGNGFIGNAQRVLENGDGLAYIYFWQGSFTAGEKYQISGKYRSSDELIIISGNPLAANTGNAIPFSIQKVWLDSGGFQMVVFGANNWLEIDEISIKQIASAELSVKRNYSVTATTQTYALTGIDQTFSIKRNFSLSATTQSFTLTGVNVNLSVKRNYSLTATTRTYALVGIDQTLYVKRNYTLTAQTVTDFIGLNIAGNWVAMSVNPINGDVYAVNVADVYKQTGGVGSFVAQNATGTARWFSAITVNPKNGDVYTAVYQGDIYKQTGGTGDWNPLGVTNNWIGIGVNPNNGDVYACAYNVGIYKQTGGIGTFDSQSAGALQWRGLALNYSTGDVYCCAYGGDIYKQTASSGSFSAVGAGNLNWRGMGVNIKTNDVYACVDGGDIYKQNGGIGGWNPLNATGSAKAWRAPTPNSATGEVYACVPNVDIYKQSLPSNYYCKSTRVSLTVKRNYSVSAITQPYTLTGVSVTLIKTGVQAYSVQAVSQSFSVTGISADLKIKRSFELTATPQSYSLTLQNADLAVKRNYKLQATLSQGYILTGIDAGLDEKLGFAIYATPQAYVLTGVSAGIKRDSHIGLSVQDFNVTGVTTDLIVQRHYTLTTHPQDYELNTANTGSEYATNFGGQGQTDWVDSNADGLADDVTAYDGCTYSIVTGNGFTGNAQRAIGDTNGGNVVFYFDYAERSFWVKVSGKYRASSPLAIWYAWFGTVYKWFNSNTGTALPFTHTFFSEPDPNLFTSFALGVPINGSQWVELDEISVKEVFPPTVDMSVKRNYTLTSITQSYTLTGIDPTLTKTGVQSYTIQGTTQAYAVTGNNINLGRTCNIISGLQIFSVSGQEATFKKGTHAGVTVQGEFSVSGIATDLIVQRNYTLTTHPQVYELNTAHTGPELATNFGGEGQTDWIDSDGDGVADDVSTYENDAYSIVTGNGFTGRAQRVLDLGLGRAGALLSKNFWMTPGFRVKVSGKYRSSVLLALEDVWYSGTRYATFPINTGNALPFAGTYNAVQSPNQVTYIFMAGWGDNAWIEIDEWSIKEVFPLTADLSVKRNYTLGAITQSYVATLGNTDLAVKRNFKLQIALSQSYSLTLQNADLAVKRNYKLQATLSQGYILTGTDAGLDEKLGFAIYATPQAYALTGVSIGIKRDSHIGLSVQDFNVTGVEIDLKIKRNYKLTATAQGFRLNEVGSEIVTNGDFSQGTTGWSLSGVGVTISGGAMTIDSPDGSYVGAWQFNKLTIGKAYHFYAEVTINSGAGGIILCANAGEGVISSGGKCDGVLIADGIDIEVKRLPSQIVNATIDNISVIEVTSAELTVKRNYSIAATTQTYSVTGVSATLTETEIHHYVIQGITQGYTLTGVNINLGRTCKIVSLTQSFNVTGVEAGFRKGTHAGVSVPQGFSVTGVSVNLSVRRNYRLTATVQSYTIQGRYAYFNEKIGYALYPSGQEYVITGIAVNVRVNLTMTATTREYTVTGKTGVFAVKRRYTLQATAGSFVITGQGISMVIARRLQGMAGAFLLSGKDINPLTGRHFTLSAGEGEFDFTGMDTALILVALGLPVYMRSGMAWVVAGLQYYSGSGEWKTGETSVFVNGEWERVRSG